MEKEAFRSGFIAILGAPNVGKSTLLNTLMGTKLSIVSPKPQTTRHRILGIKNLPQAQLIFVDTPGIHQPRTRLNQYMMRAVLEALIDPQLVLYMTDVTKQPYPDLDFLRRHLRDTSVPVFWVLNKIDRIRRQELLPLIEAYPYKEAFAEVIPISALRGENIDDLLRTMLRYLPEGPRYFPEDMPTDRDERFFIAELIREQVLLRTHQEVPYAVAVSVESVTPRDDGSLEVTANILVEKPSQKAILIGQQGRMIKAIGMHARQAISTLLRRPVHLHLWVKVRQGWKDQEAILRELGFHQV
ncbi:MAG: GTPase Era [Candidatus Tectimicrobiota bacterium]|nr:MAG: GTPase Era [Candidatus Tectomicrobia bacterium]